MCSVCAGQAHAAAAYESIRMIAQVLVSKACERIITSEDERLRALQHMCLAIPRTAQALHEEVRQADRRAVSHTCWLHVCSAHGIAALSAGALMREEWPYARRRAVLGRCQVLAALAWSCP